MNTKSVFSIICVLLLPVMIRAEIRLPQILGDNMVLQRNTECTIWGWAGKGEQVSVSFRDLHREVQTGRDGRWAVTLPPMEAGGPYEMLIKGKNEIRLTNILVGDVWVCSGQSNMEWPVSRSRDAEAEIEAADYPGIRLFHAPRNIQFEPAEDVGAGAWALCSPGTIANFSAVAYFFGRHIHREIGVPVGLLMTCWGGTNVETWTSGISIGNEPEFAERVKKLGEYDAEKEIARKKAELEELVTKYGADKPGLVDGRALWAEPKLDESLWGEMELPALWEDRGLTGLDGVVWFRKEFDLNAEMAAAGIMLELGPVDDSDITWVNGHKVGEMTQAYSSARYYVVAPEYLKEGRNVLAIRVEDTGGGGGLYGDPEQLRVVSDNKVISLAGKWKYKVSPVALEINIRNYLGPNSNPTLLFNGMIHPFLNFPVRGVIWYQGESNAARAYRYRDLFPLLIKDWRMHWDNPEMPFLFVQLANFMEAVDKPTESDWAELREAQLMALSLPNTGMAVAIDIGEADDIHPRNKQDVGRRLALAAMNVAYDRDVVHSGPVFREMDIEGSRAILSFDHTGTGLAVRDKYGYVNGFAVAGADRKFHWAKAFLDGNKVVVYSGKVEQPVAVRYGWAANPDDLNLYNKEGLPASPFRTDSWPGVTVDKK